MGVPGNRAPIRLIPSAALVLLAGLCGQAAASQERSAKPFPEPRPSTRAEAVVMIRGAETARPCLTPEIQLAGRGIMGTAPVTRRALALLQRRATFSGERTVEGPDGIPVRYAPAALGYDRIDPTDRDRDGVPDVLQATLEGLVQARGLLVGQLELPRPDGLEVLLVELDDPLGGYLVPPLARGSRATLVLDASPRGGPDGARRAAVHQYAHAVALAAGTSFPVEWSEALATWATIRLQGLEPATAAQLDDRLRRLSDGLLDPDLSLAAGNALWFSFLDEAYGAHAVRLTVGALARENASVAMALDLGVRQASEDDLASAFREFHLWSLFVGQASDGEHFSFAEGLASPSFASTTAGLPALSVQSDPPVAPLGAAHVRIRPEEHDGGLRIDIEGDFPARWEADLLLIGKTGVRHRLPLPLTVEGRGESTVPLDGLAEAVVLLRSLGSDDTRAHRYTYAARVEKGFPYEIASLRSTRLPDPGAGVLVEWETSSEQRLVGFNLMRKREAGGPLVIVNPIWIPALGDGTHPTSYRFVDPDADPQAAYLYRIQGITTDGLTAVSEPVDVPASN